MRNLNLTKQSTPIDIQHRRNPLHVIENELNKAMRSFYNAFDMPSFNLENFENLMLTPAIDIVDEKDNFKVEVEMPGISEEDVKVSISDGMLTIKGEKSTSTKDTGKNYIMREINYGAYTRNIALPDTVDLDKATATFKKGMLWINIPKKTEVAKKSRELRVEGLKEQHH